MSTMTFMDWIRAWRHPTTIRNALHNSAHEKANENWLAEEEHRQLQEVRERLERVEVQLAVIARRRTDS